MKLAALLLSLAFVTTSLHAQVWEQTNGPSGNTIKKIFFNKKKDMFVLSSVLMKSTDRGASWKQVATQFTNGAIAKIAVSAVGDLYVIIYDTDFGPMGNDGLWKSTDDGETWTNVVASRNLTYMIMSPDSSIHVGYLEGSKKYSYRSFDQGATWVSSMVSDNASLGSGAADVNGNLFCMGNQVYRSSDKGATWGKVFGLPASSYGGISSAPNGDIYLSAVGSLKGFYRSVDGGLMWTRIQNLAPDDENLMGSAVSPTGRVLLVCQYNVLYSDDRGSTWKSFGKVTHDLGFTSFPTGVWAADLDGGFYLSMMGEHLVRRATPDTFEVISTPLSSVPALFCNSDGNVFASSQSYSTLPSGFWRSSSEGRSWSAIYQTHERVFTPSYIERDSNQTLLAADTRALFASEKENVWEQITPDQFISGKINAIVATPNRRLFLATSSDGMLLSPDNGTVWWPVNSGLSGMNVTAATVAKDNTLFVALTNKLFQSKDNGTSWQEISIGAFTGKIFKLTVISETLYAGVIGQGIARSSDQGKNWEFLSNDGLQNTTFLSMLVVNDGSILVGTDSGAFRFASGVWSRFDEGITTKVVTSLAQDKNGNLYAGTVGAGVFINRMVGSNVEQRAELRGITILHPSPNPASDHLSYGFTCEDAMSVRIGLYEVTGKRVSMLVDKHFSPGSYSFTLPTTGLASGAYLLSFATSTGTETRSIVIQ